MTASLDLDDLLVAHAAGKLAEPVALVIATHLALSPASRLRYRRYEAVGGVLLEAIEPEPVAADSWERLAARLDDEIEPREPSPEDLQCAAALPAPLRPYVPGSLDELKWRSYGAAAEADLITDAGGFRTRLIRVKAGRAVPRHTHSGSEITVVIEGAYHDELGRFGRGDIEIADDTVDHQPVAEEGRDCLCLAVTDAPLRLTGPITRFLNPFLRI
jgi:putative transcriptional regulator